MSTRSPVLFLVFNRPDTTQRVFDAIRAARPARLYIAADGPRAGRPGEAHRCDEVRRIASAVDWPCDVQTLLRSENLGCKRAVSTAITWFFEHELEGIVLEDDCLPDRTFFPYCDELLERYRDDPRVMCVSGDSFISNYWQPLDSYYFSKYPHPWGWASWRRAWKQYDVDMCDWQSQSKTDLLKSALSDAPWAWMYWREIFDLTATGKIDTWDYQWFYACWKSNGLTCVPGTNLISNIGFGEDATHTKGSDSGLSRMPTASMDTPLRHPSILQANIEADNWTSENVFEIGRHESRLSRWRRAVIIWLRQVRARFRVSDIHSNRQSSRASRSGT